MAFASRWRPSKQKFLRFRSRPGESGHTPFNRTSTCDCMGSKCLAVIERQARGLDWRPRWLSSDGTENASGFQTGAAGGRVVRRLLVDFAVPICWHDARVVVEPFLGHGTRGRWRGTKHRSFHHPTRKLPDVIETGLRVRFKPLAGSVSLPNCSARSALAPIRRVVPAFAAGRSGRAPSAWRLRPPIEGVLAGKAPRVPVPDWSSWLRPPVASDCGPKASRLASVLRICFPRHKG
jgi:hypothetical protein